MWELINNKTELQVKHFLINIKSLNDYLEVAAR